MPWEWGSNSTIKTQQVNKREVFLLGAAVEVLVPEMLGTAMAMAQSVSASTSPVQSTINCMLGSELPV